MTNNKDASNDTRKKDDRPCDCVWWHDPSTANVLLAAFTFFLVIVGCFQGWILWKTDQTSRLRDRAFIYFGDPNLFLYPSHNPINLGIGLTVHNAGNMPARNVLIRHAYISRKLNTVSDPFGLVRWSITEAPKVIGPKQALQLQAGAIPLGIIESARKMETDVFLVWEAEYTDGFELDKHRITRMSRVVRFDKYGGQSLGIGPSNCTDDDCERKELSKCNYIP